MATFTNTAKWALRRLTGASLVSETDDGFAALADDVDALLTPFTWGIGANRPTSSAATPGKAGRTYYATDWGIEYVDLGTEWAVRGGYTGKISMNLLGTVPSGHLAMNGQAVTTAYPRLRSLLLAAGRATNAGGDPLLPNMADHAPIGAGTLAALGVKIGAATVTLTEAQLPNHDHPPQEGGQYLHTGGTDFAIGSGTGSVGFTDGAGAGSGQAHPNVQPSIGVQFVIQA